MSIELDGRARSNRKMDLLMEMADSATRQKIPQNNTSEGNTMRSEELSIMTVLEIEKVKIAQTTQLLKDLQTLGEYLKSVEKKFQSLEENIRTASSDIKRYPVEIISQVSTRLEQTLFTCEATAQRAKDHFIEATKLQEQSGKNFNFWIIVTSIASSLFAVTGFIILRSFF